MRAAQKVKKCQLHPEIRLKTRENKSSDGKENGQKEKRSNFADHIIFCSRNSIMGLVFLTSQLRTHRHTRVYNPSARPDQIRFRDHGHATVCFSVLNYTRPNLLYCSRTADIGERECCHNPQMTLS